MTTEQNHPGAALRALRLQCSPPMRQGALAERVKLTPSMVSQIESGARRMSLAFVVAVAEVLACHLPLTKPEIIIRISMPDWLSNSKTEADQC